MKRIALFATLVACLTACGEKPQTMALPRSDAPSYTGVTTGSAGSSAFTAPGWKPGDKTGWEQHLKARQQNSQNDYSKMN
jgi:hypothetical protein